MDAALLPHTRLSRLVDPLIEKLGRWVSWVWLLLMVTIVCNVLLRYSFSEGRIELEELQWHMYSAGFLLTLGYALLGDAHIRVDVVHERLSPRHQAWIELYGMLLLLFPFVALILIYAIPFVASSYALSEVSQSPGGLPLRWLIKAALPLGFVLLLLAALSRFSRVWVFLFGGERDA